MAQFKNEERESLQKRSKLARTICIVGKKYEENLYENGSAYYH